VPEHRLALDRAGVAMRLEEVEMLRLAHVAANRAVELAPWNHDARLLRARIAFRMASISPTFSAMEEAARRDLDVVTRLYPEDGAVLVEASLVLAEFGNRADHDQLLRWGGLVLAMNRSQAGNVLSAWNMGGISVEQVLSVPDLPISGLWQLYGLLERARRVGEAAGCLEAIGRALDENRAPPESALWLPAAWDRWEKEQARNRIRWTRETLRHALRRGDFGAVRALDSRRRQVLHRQIEMELSSDAVGEGATSMRRLRLREGVAQGRIPPSWLVEWAMLEIDFSLTARPVQEAVVEALLVDAFGEDELRRLFELRPNLSDLPMLVDLLNAKSLEMAGQPGDAATRIERWLREPQAYSRRFLKRMWLWQAELLEMAGRSEEAESARGQAALYGPGHPAYGGWAVGQDAPLDIRYKGGRLRLLGLERTAPEDEPPMRMAIDWRFDGLLPHDLAVEVRFRHSNGRILARKRAALDGEFEVEFNRGAPVLGTAWRWEVELPANAVYAESVQLLVWSKSKLVATDEGLSLVEIDLERIPRAAPEIAESPPAEPDAASEP
jgi:tetratricopeptide (TPR) repeat protein